MAEIRGNFVDRRDKIGEYLIVSFCSANIALKDRWRTNSLSADFLASYWGAFIPAPDFASDRRRDEVVDAVGFISNELLENALKYHHEASGHPVKIGLYLSSDFLYFYVSNTVDPDCLDNFKRFIDEILAADVQELYIRKLEENADRDDRTESQLGVLTILNNYDAELAWKFERIPDIPESVSVTTMARLTVIRSARNALKKT